jgi:S-adenosylmethionine-dependent methyltransferase
LQEKIRFHVADVSQLNRIFPQSQFDAIVCHNVLQFVADVPTFLTSLAKTLVPGGILSLMSGNRFTIPYRAAFMARDLDKALELVGSRNSRNVIFNTTVTEYSADEIQEMLPDAGLAFDNHYGIRCLLDYWGSNETKLQPEVWEKIVKLEYALTDKYPYNLLARFWQVVTHKT